MGQLFEEPAEAVARDGDVRVVGVAVHANVWRVYDYLWPTGLGEPLQGIRVRVPLGKGNRKTLGFVVALDRPRPGDVRLKPVAQRIDDESPFDETLWRLGRWLSEYYLAPLGMTLAAMVPSAVGARTPRTEAVLSLTSEPEDGSRSLGDRQRRVLDELREARKQGVDALPLEEVLRRSGASRDTIRRLRERQLVASASREVTIDSLQGAPEPDPFEPNEAQLAALSAIEPALASGQYSTTLLHGVTGSGKTEVYIRAIRRVVEAGGQAILLVPEIALATQTLGRLIRRLPRVAVLHSGLTDSQRAFYWQQIRDGHAAVVVGPRSAAFAPTRKLRLIIVDEEHEGSYKQDTLPRYHGRDVAIKRASLCGSTVVLGSATPSMETLHNARTGRYSLLRLPARVRGLAMPSLRVVNLRKDFEGGRIELIGQTLTGKLAAALDRGEQAILLMNRRGYSSYVFCPSCQWIYCCEHCTRAMVFHQATQMAICHYCQTTGHLPAACPACDGKLLYFGFGIQRVEDELGRKFPDAVCARMDSDTMTSPAQFRRVLEDFAAGKIDILLGTQMVAKGLDFPNVSVVGIASADTALAVPDFRASERTFQLIVQVAGRAGRGEVAGEVVVQTLHEDEPAVRYATSHDYDGFAEGELRSREQMRLPPYSRMVRVIARHADGDTAREGAERFAAELERMLPGGAARLVGPQPAGVRRIRGLFRFHLFAMTDRPGLIQRHLAGRMARLTRENPAEIVIDADPMNLI